jgi:GntR family transcriptional regulator, transcriptional repressor for pyruvate dehydrogenase complex
MSLAAAIHLERDAGSTLPEHVANRLLRLIREEALRPGDRLPAERVLARQMGVSRSVLREALRALALMRVVDIRHGAGTSVTALEPEQLVSHLDFVFPRDRPALVKLFEARRVVECGNARLAAERVSGAQLVHLHGLLGELGEAVGDAGQFSDLDIAFHDAVCGAADNFLLDQLMRIVNTLGRVSRQETGSHRSVRKQALADHGRIVAALERRDPAAAEAAMREHLDHAAAALEPPEVEP